MHVLVLGALLFLFLAPLSGCREQNTKSPEESILKTAEADSPDALVKVSEAAARQKNPRRIVSLMPSTTELVYFLEAGDRLVGRSESCNYPPEATRLPIIGGFYNPNIELIMNLKPDLIVAAEMRNHPSYKQMIDLGLPLVEYTPTNLSDALEMIRDLGKRLGMEDVGREKAAALQARIDAIRKRSERRTERPSVYIEIWDDPLQTLGNESYINEMLEIAGARNIFGDVDDDYPKISLEAAIERNPDVILFAYMKKDWEKAQAAAKRPGWGQISAIRNGRWYVDIDPDLYLRVGPRLVDGIEAIEAKLFPPDGAEAGKR